MRTYKRQPLDHFWRKFDRNISKAILDECWTKSRPIRTYKKRPMDHFWQELDKNISTMMITDVCWTIPWNNPTYKRQPLDHLIFFFEFTSTPLPHPQFIILLWQQQRMKSNKIDENTIRKYTIFLQWFDENLFNLIPKVYWTTSFERIRCDYWTIFGRDWTEIYSTWSLVHVRQNQDPCGRTRGHCFTIFEKLDGNISNMITDKGDMWGGFRLSQCLNCLLHSVFTEICCSQWGVAQGLPMCYSLTKRRAYFENFLTFA